MLILTTEFWQIVIGGSYMNDAGKTMIAELAYELSKVTRRAIDKAEGQATPVELTMIANSLLEAGYEKVPSDSLKLFVAGFEAGHPSERRSNLTSRL